jgi:hypothetical protein
LAIFGAAAIVVIAAAATLTGLGPESPPAFRVAHVSPDAPPLDVYIDGALVEAGLIYGRVGPLRSAGRAGALNVALRLAGTSPDAAPLLTANVSLSPGTAYVIAIANNLEHLQIGSYALPTANLLPDRTRIHVIHATPNAPRIGVRAGPEVVANGLGYLEDPPYLDVPSGSTRMLGFTSEIPAVLLFDVNRPLEPGTVETILLTGFPLRAIFFTTRPG